MRGDCVLVLGDVAEFTTAIRGALHPVMIGLDDRSGLRDRVRFGSRHSLPVRREALSIPVIASGGIATGASTAAAVALDASVVNSGTYESAGQEADI
jgi:hypothetical protein